MNPSNRRWSDVCLFALAALVLAPGTVPADGFDDLAQFRVRLGDDETARAARLALAGASALLAEEKCRALFQEFSDAGGRPLAERLTALGETPSGYLRLILWTDGSSLRVCREHGASAATSPGSRVVHVCPREFRELQRRDPVRAQLSILHETLHTLGLGENPPTPAAITAAVRARCIR